MWLKIIQYEKNKEKKKQFFLFKKLFFLKNKKV